MDSRYQAYVAGLKALGKSLLSFNAPCCGQVIETLPACTDDTWTPLASCPHCGALYRKIVTRASAHGVPLAQHIKEQVDEPIN